MGVIVLGTGSCLPKRVVSNVEMEKIVDTSDEWIRTRTGIEERRFGGKGEKNYQLAAEAGRRALEMAGVAPDEIGLVIVGTISSHMVMPSTACFVQDALGLKNAFAWDLVAACSGFINGLDVAEKYIKADKTMKVLVIGAETLSARLNYKDRNTCIIFGDGAGAAVFGFCEDGKDGGERGILGSSMSSDGSLWQLLCMRSAQSSNPDLLVEELDDPYIHMQGKEVFKYAVRSMADSVDKVLAQTGISLDEIDLLIPHQANIRIINNLKKKLQIPNDRVFVNVAKYGNTSAASVPIAIDEANRAGLLRKGANVLLCAFGGGFTWGAVLLKW